MRVRIGSAMAIAFLAFGAAAFGLPAFTTSPKTSSGAGGHAELFGIAASCHATFDRFVIRARSATPGYAVRYVNEVFDDASGKPVALLGRKRMRAVIRGAHGVMGVTTDPLSSFLDPRCSNLRQVKVTGNFEGFVSFGLGLRRRTGFRVFRLTNPTRLVIDIAH